MNEEKQSFEKSRMTVGKIAFTPYPYNPIQEIAKKAAMPENQFDVSAQKDCDASSSSTKN